MIDHDIFYLDKVETHRSIVCNTRVGSRAPAYATSSGKILLSEQSETYIEEYYSWMRQNARALTANTITDPERLHSELIHAKLQGFAVDREEIEAGLICVGAPIFDINHRAVAAISISGPNYRMQADWETMVREVRKTAEKISTLLGYKFMR